MPLSNGYNIADSLSSEKSVRSRFRFRFPLPLSASAFRQYIAFPPPSLRPTCSPRDTELPPYTSRPIEEAPQVAAWRISKMRERCLCSSDNKISSNGQEPTECMINLSEQQFRHGDIVWKMIDGESWWPVQVVDDKSVACKPKKIKNDQILVRLYGTYEHIYVEPADCVMKIEKIFGQEHTTKKEIFQKTLEKDLAHTRSCCQSEARVSISKEIEEAKDETPRGSGQRKEKLRRTMTANNSNLVDSSEYPRAAKQSKVVGKSSGYGITKRRTRSETLKARNEVLHNTGNPNSGTSPILSFDKRDLRCLRPFDAKEELASNVFEKVSESEWIECSDVKDIKKLVTKIVKEVAAEKARNEASINKWLYIENSRKGFDKFSSVKQHSSSLKNKDLEDKSVAPSDAGKPNEDQKLSDGNSLINISSKCGLRNQHFVCDYSNERKDDIGTEMPEEIRGIDCVQQCQLTSLESYLMGTDREEKPLSRFSNSVMEEMKLGEADEAMSEVQRGRIANKQGALKDQINKATKCLLSPRCTRVKQSLGLIAPLGSPFCRNGLIESINP